MAERYLKTEYQTLRRLLQTQAVLFTVRTFVEPLAEVPAEARRTLEASARGMSSAMLEYKGIAPAGATEQEARESLAELQRLLGAVSRV